MQQPFFLSVDRLFISTKTAKYITPFDSNSDNGKIKYSDFIYNKNVQFFKNTKKEWTSSAGGKYNSYISNQAYTNIKVRYKKIYGMNIYIKRGNHRINKSGEFRYYIGGSSGDFEMHGKNMIRKTRECNLNLMIKLYPIVGHIKNFYKKLHITPFFDIIIGEILNNKELAEFLPKELEFEYGYLKDAIKYNL